MRGPGIGVGRRSIVPDKCIHAVGHSLTGSLVRDVPIIIAFGIHHIFELQIAVLLGFQATAVTQIVVVTLVVKASEEVSHVSDTGPKRRWAASIFCARVASAVWVNSDGSKIGGNVLVPIFLCVGVQRVQPCLRDLSEDIGIGISRAVPSRAWIVPRWGLFGITESGTFIRTC